MSALSRIQAEAHAYVGDGQERCRRCGGEPEPHRARDRETLSPEARGERVRQLALDEFAPWVDGETDDDRRRRAAAAKARICVRCPHREIEHDLAGGPLVLRPIGRGEPIRARPCRKCACPSFEGLR